MVDAADKGALEIPRDRTISWEFIFIAVVLTLTLMTGMFFMGQALSDEKVGKLGDTLEQFALERDAQDLSRRIAQNLPHNNCKALNVATSQTIDDIRNLRENMEVYEQARKLENDEYETLKKRYTNLLLEYWLTTQEIEEMCGSDIVTVLYIYSTPGECPRCADQGTVLTKYRQEYDNQLLVFPLDASLDLKPVELIINSYGIDQYPALIVGDDYYEGFKNNEEFGNILKAHMNQTTRTTNSTMNGTVNREITVSTVLNETNSS